jgi:hypothetical protein
MTREFGKALRSEKTPLATLYGAIEGKKLFSKAAKVSLSEF